MGCGASSQPEEPNKTDTPAEAGDAPKPAPNKGESGCDKTSPPPADPAAPQPAEAEQEVAPADPANSPLVPVPGSADDHHEKPVSAEQRPIDDSRAQTTEIQEGAIPQLESKQAEEGAGAEQEQEQAWIGPETSMVTQRLQMDNKTADEVVKRFEAALPAGAAGLTKEQFRAVLPELASTTPLLVDRLFGCFDADKNGLVDKSEFMAVLASLCSGASESKKCQLVFGMYDSDGDGCVTKAELEQVLSAYFWSRTVVIEQMSVEEFDDFDEEPAQPAPPKAPVGLECREILDDFVNEIFKADTDGNQLLSFVEFEKWLMTARASNSLQANVMVKWVDVLVGAKK